MTAPRTAETLEIRALDAPLAVGELLRATASSRPDEPAIVDERGTLTYAELDAAVDSVCVGLAGAGIRHGDSVAYLLFTQREAIIAFLGSARLGAVAVPLNHRLTTPELAYQVTAARARYLLVDHRLTRLIGDDVAGSVPITVVGGDEDEFESLSHSHTIDAFRPDRVPSADDVCSIWFTSGTTGPPKGAAVRHRSEIAAATTLAIACSFTPESRVLGVAPLFHRAPNAMAVATMLVGGTMFLRQSFVPDEVLELIERERLTAGFIVPTMGWMLVNSPGAGEHDLSSMEQWISASAPLTPALEQAINSTFNLPYGVSNFYGITENLLLTQRRGPTALGSVGRVINQVSMRVFDGERFVPPGEIGEVVAASPTTFSHYINNAEATAAAVIAVDGRQWYRSGDVGYFDKAGSLFLVDRAKDMIITGGENVYSAEVELAVAEHPSICEVAVVGVPDEKWGERVVAVCTLIDGAVEPSVQAVREQACAGLAKYKQPTEIHFLAELPKNGFGKVRKDIVRRLVSEAAAAR